MNNNSFEQPSPDTTPVESPDYLATPTRGKGVRRMNRLPLFIVGGIVSISVLGIVYTFYDRQNQNMSKVAEGPQPPVTEISLPPVKPGDYAPPEPLPIEMGNTGIPTESTNTPSPLQSELEESENRRRTIQRIEERKLAQLESALSSESQAQNFHVRSTQNDTTNIANNDPLAPIRAAINNAAMAEKQVIANNGINENETDDSLYGLSVGIGGTGGISGLGSNSGIINTSMASDNRQLEKQAFLSNTPEAITYLQHQRKAAVVASREVKAGTIIPGVMISGLNSDLPGQIIAQVRENVYDSATGNTLLIPAGARLIGVYDSNVTLGQERALVGWERIIYPDGSSISLDRMPGGDVAGYAGFNDQVNNHYWRLFGHGILLSVFTAGIQLSQPKSTNNNSYSSQQIVAGALGQQMGQIGMRMAQRNMNIQPTLEVRPGYKFNVMITKDIILPPWTGHPLSLR